MEISLHQLGKRYRFEWIFKDLDFEFKAGSHYAILGSNGSGKSTLMKVLSGHLTPSKGKIQHIRNNVLIPPNEVYLNLSFAAPYIELIEEYTLREALDFHRKFKPFLNDMRSDEVLEIISLPKNNQHKDIRFFSSGMKQRLKLAMAILSDTSLLLLDEPTTNLDTKGMDWYLGLIEKFKGNRTIIVASNEERDYGFCDEKLNIMDFKKKKSNETKN